jgi:hypothetical protein
MRFADKADITDAVQGGGRGGTGFGRGGSRRRSDQAADCAAWPREIGRISNADRVPGEYSSGETNIERDELVALKKLARELLEYDEKAIASGDVGSAGGDDLR